MRTAIDALLPFACVLMLLAGVGSIRAARRDRDRP